MDRNELIAEVRMLRVLMSVVLEALPNYVSVQARLAEVIREEIERTEALQQKSVADRIFIQRMKAMSEERP